jgi:hypothetical protein
MQVGDLVTLSARGKKLENCWRWKDKCDAGKMVGLVLRIEDPKRSWQKDMYTVKWIGDGPRGREPYHISYWHRSDLKFVARVKK